MLTSVLTRAVTSVRGGGRAPYLWGSGGVILAAGCWWISRGLFVSRGKRANGTNDNGGAFGNRKYSQEESDVWRAEKEAEEKLRKARLDRALAGGAELEIAIDMSYGPESQIDKHCSSLAKQLGYVYSFVRKANVCTLLHLTSYKGESRAALERRGAGSWKANKREEDLTKVFADRRHDIVFLSPDAEDTLWELQKGTVYVIGGLIDKSVQKNLALDRARNLGFRCVRLPVSEHVPRNEQVCAQPDDGMYESELLFTEGMCT